MAIESSIEAFALEPPGGIIGGFLVGEPRLFIGEEPFLDDPAGDGCFILDLIGDGSLAADRAGDGSLTYDLIGDGSFFPDLTGVGNFEADSLSFYAGPGEGYFEEREVEDFTF